MKTMKILFALVVFVMMGLTVNAQAKKDTTVIMKLGIHCPSCKAKLDKNMPFEKGVKDYKFNMKDSTVLITYRMDKNTLPGLKAAIEKHDVKVVGMCDKNGKLIKSNKKHECCKEGTKGECDGDCAECDHHGDKKNHECEEDHGCSKTENSGGCCGGKKK